MITMTIVEGVSKQKAGLTSMGSQPMLNFLLSHLVLMQIPDAPPAYDKISASPLLPPPYAP